MSSSLRVYRTSREQIYQIARDTKWMIAVSVLLSVILFLPEQIRELYRIVVADITFVNFNLKDAIAITITLAKMIVPLLVLSLVLWAGLYQVTTESVGRLGNLTPLTATLVRLLPPIFGVLPLVASALGQLLSVPSLSGFETSRELVAGPWDDFGLGLSNTIGLGLKISSLLTFLVAIALLAGERITHKWRALSSELNAHYFDDPRFLLLTVVLIVLFATAFRLAPVAFPQAIGVFGIVAIFALCVVAFCVHFSLLTIEHRLPLIPSLFGLVVIFALFDLNDNHDVRPLEKPQPPAASGTAAETFRQWYESRPDLADYDEYPVYVVAAQGGGIYAAYQTAIFLARLHDYCPVFGDHLFAISSVSGGSIGAAAFSAAMHARAEQRFTTAGMPVSTLPAVSVAADPCPPITEYLLSERAPRPNLEDPGTLEINLRKYFANDFLSPLIGATLFLDFSQGYLPFPVGALDRARSLEFAFEKAEEAFGGTDYLSRHFQEHRSSERRAPALLINATDAGSGRRVVIAPFSLDSGGNTSVVRYQELGRGKDGKNEQYPPDIRLSTAAGISARFPWVTPAATVPVSDVRFGPQKKMRLVDGGYVDNSGVETALDLLDAIRGTIDDINAKADDPQQTIGNTGMRYRRVRVKLISLSGGDYAVRSSFALGDALEPVRALLSTRSSRAYVAIDRATKEFPLYDVAELKAGTAASVVRARDFRRGNLTSRFYPLPLGWAMSNRTRQIIEKQSGYYWNCEPSLTFTQSQPTLSETDCIQLLIYHELNRSLKTVAREIAAANLVVAQGGSGSTDPRVPHAGVIGCYRDQAVPQMTRRQAQSLEALLTIWDDNRQWPHDRWLAFILGTIASETGNFQVRVENLSFKSPVRIQSLWPARFATPADAAPFVNKPEELAERVYGDRFGNTEQGDAWRYRGRGMAMLHGREEYERYGARIGVDLLENPEWVLNPAVGARAAFHAYFDKPVMEQLGAYLNEKQADWDGAISNLKRVYDKQGIAWRSQIFEGCIAAARKGDRP